MTSNLKVNNILPSTGTTVAVSGIASVTSSVSIASSCTATTFYGSGANLTNLPSQVTITGNANDKVITGGSGTNLVGETRLTFDGNSLDITGAGSHPFSVGGGDYRNLIISGNSQSSSGFIYLGNGAATNNADFDLGRIRIYNGATQVAQISGTTDTSANDDGRITLHTRNTGGSLGEKLRITSDGRTLINTTAVTNTHDQLTVKRAASSFGEMSMSVDANTSTSSAANAFIFTKSKHTYWNGYGFQSSHGHIGAIVGKRDSTGGDSDQEIRIEIGGTHINQSEEKTWNFKNNGDLSISDGNLVVASGHGIDFSSQSTNAQQNSPTTDDEVLQYYEKGKWTPDVRKNGVSNATPSVVHGRYVRVGQMVWLSMYARWASGSNSQGSSGSWEIYGLPFSLQDDNPGTCRIYQFAPAGYFYINSTYYGNTNVNRWQVNNNTKFSLYTSLSSSQLSWNSGAMGISLTGCFMIHE